MSDMRVAVIGIGPSGLTATAAAQRYGCKVELFARSLAPSALYGCQYLHGPIPGFTDVAMTDISYQLLGTPEEYRAKVYGPNWAGRVSPDDFIGDHIGWDLRATYSQMYERYVKSGAIPFTPLRVTPERLVETTEKFQQDFDIVISTVP